MTGDVRMVVMTVESDEEVDMSMIATEGVGVLTL